MIQYVEPALPLPKLWVSREQRKLVAGVDLAFTADGCALVILERHHDRLVTIEHDFRLPKPNEPLDPIAVTNEYLDRVSRIGCKHVIADVHYIELLRKAANDRGVTLHNAPAGDARIQSWVTTRHYTREKSIAYPKESADHLRKIRSSARTGGGMTISAPRGEASGHADLAYALAAAVWLDARLHGIIGALNTEIKTHKGAWTAP